MIAAIFALTLFPVFQLPALKPEAKPPAVTAPAPLPEVLTLKLEKNILLVGIAQRDLEASDAAKLFKATMEELRKQREVMLIEVEKLRPGYTWDFDKMALVPKPPKKDGK